MATHANPTVPTSYGNLALRRTAMLPMSSASMVVVERVTGQLSAADLQQLTDKLVARWDPSLRIRLLVDLCSADLGQVGLDDLFEYVRYVEHIGLHQRAPIVALVAGRDTNHNLARLYQSLVRHEEGALAVFGEVEEALQWIRHAGE